jgi:hypothetical protein
MPIRSNFSCPNLHPMEMQNTFFLVNMNEYFITLFGFTSLKFAFVDWPQPILTFFDDGHFHPPIYYFAEYFDEYFSLLNLTAIGHPHSTKHLPI